VNLQTRTLWHWTDKTKADLYVSVGCGQGLITTTPVSRLCFARSGYLLRCFARRALKNAAAPWRRRRRRSGARTARRTCRWRTTRATASRAPHSLGQATLAARATDAPPRSCCTLCGKVLDDAIFSNEATFVKGYGGASQARSRCLSLALALAEPAHAGGGQFRARERPHARAGPPRAARLWLPCRRAGEDCEQRRAASSPPSAREPVLSLAARRQG